MKGSRSTPETIDHDELLVHNWRARRLQRLGIPGPMAEAHADRLDWHQVATLVQRGCPPVPCVSFSDADREGG